MDTTLNLKTNEKGFFLSSLKGSLIALFVSLISILIFAFVLKFVEIPDAAIKPVNQAIKAVSVLVGTFVALKKSSHMGLISGILIGLLYTIISFLVFSLLDRNFEFTKVVINDLLFGGIIGAICGILAVNTKKKALK